MREGSDVTRLDVHSLDICWIFISLYNSSGGPYTCVDCLHNDLQLGEVTFLSPRHLPIAIH